MFVSGMFSWLRVPMMITSALIAIPTGIKIFSWLATLFEGKIHLESTGMLFALGFVCSFILGGISGVMTAMVPIDIHVTDTYFIVAHIHFVLFAGSVFTIFAGIYHWFPKITGRMYDERLGRWHFWLTLLGHLGHVRADALDRDGGHAAPRRRLRRPVRRLEPGDLGRGFMLGAAQLVFLYNMIVSWRWGPRPRANPWRAKTIEWLVSSPPPRFNFHDVPRVVGGPYEFGVPGARHAVMRPDQEARRPVIAGELGSGRGP